MIPDEEYRTILDLMPICCVDVVIHHDERVLLVERADDPVKGEWWIPGGRLHKNETLRDCAIRKAKEETGLDVEVVRKVGVYETFFEESPYENLQTGIHSVNVCFLVWPVGEAVVTIDKTCSRYNWIDRIESDLDPRLKLVLEDSGVFNR